jgi:hypothetical protein
MCFTLFRVKLRRQFSSPTVICATIYSHHNCSLNFKNICHLPINSLHTDDLTCSQAASWESVSCRLNYGISESQRLDVVTIRLSSLLLTSYSFRQSFYFSFRLYSPEGTGILSESYFQASCVRTTLSDNPGNVSPSVVYYINIGFSKLCGGKNTGMAECKISKFPSYNIFI